MSTQQAAENSEMKQADDWLASNKLALNCCNTKFVLLTRSQKHKQIEINVVTRAVEELNQVKHLLESVLITNKNGNSK